MTTIDHAAEARKILHEATHDEDGVVVVSEFDVAEMAEWQASMAEAQVHATLALVEQQRLANELTYLHLQAAESMESAVVPGRFDESTLEASLERHAIVAQRVYEGLGL